MKKKGSRIICLILAMAMMAMLSMGSGSSHAPGYGNTSKCTICGKTATHHTSNYGYCDKHWKDATGQ
jgi:hypothetical protein